MRKWAIGVLAGVAVLALAVPAQAKGEASDVTITNSDGGSSGSGAGGPGGGGSGTTQAVLAAPIHLTGAQAAPWLGDTGVFQASQSHPATKALGPSLDVRLAYTCGDQGGTISQQLFPFAKGGAIAHMAPGQTFCDGRLPGVWWHVAPQTMGILHDAGLPASMPVVKPAADGAANTGSAGGSSAARDDAAAGSTSSRSTGVPVLPIALGVVAVAALLAVAQRKRRTIAA